MKLFGRLNIILLIAFASLIFIAKKINIIGSKNDSSLLQDTGTYHPNYYLLQIYLSNYEYIAACGGWDSIPDLKDTARLKKSLSIPNLLRKRLQRENYLQIKPILYPDSLDLALKNSLKLFQLNNGLVVSGEINAATIIALNVSVEQKIGLIKLNMERWKHLPNSFSKPSLLVNAADFSLTVIDNDTVALKMKTIIGREYRKTPVFSAKLTHIVFNPTWNIPPNILKKDILPAARKDISYLEKKHIRIFEIDSFGKRREMPITANELDKISNKGSAEFVQDPGPQNSLGAVKFVFPNHYYVYMHDTPSKELFEQSEPMYSSGCIRLSKAVDLAIYLLKKEKGWNLLKIDQTILSGKTTTVYLKNPVNVYIEYFTAWVSFENGMLQFRKDIYRRDNITQYKTEFL